MLGRVTELLSASGTDRASMPPTILYNEGWMLRLVVDWFDKNRETTHPLEFLPGARWYSEALLGTQFRAVERGDKRAESFTHADCIIGHFDIFPGARGEATVCPDAQQLVVIEAKLGSRLSSGVKNAPGFDQAARNVACMAEAVARAKVSPSSLSSFAFFVVAPNARIDEEMMNLVNVESIETKVRSRVSQYRSSKEEKTKEDWFRTAFEPALERITLKILSWESILDHIASVEPGSRLRDFYTQCKGFNLKEDDAVSTGQAEESKS